MIAAFTAASYAELVSKYPQAAGAALYVHKAFKAPLIETICSVTPEIFEKQIRALLGRPDARPVLPTIHAPSLVLVGAQDEWSPIAVNKAIADAIPGCRFELLPGVAHFPNLEDPAGLAAVLADFVATTAPARVDDADWGDIVGRRARATMRRVA